MRKLTLLTISVLLSITLVGCKKDNKAKTDDKNTTKVEVKKESEVKAGSPEETLKIVISSLKKSDGKTLNEYVIYPEVKGKNYMISGNKYFDDMDDKEDKRLVEAMFEKLSYKILNVESKGDQTVISCEISNKDFTKIIKNLLENAIDENSDEEVEMLSAIKNTKTISTKKIDITLKKIDNKWKVVIDDEFGKGILGIFGDELLED
ncbi:hypothetical protein [Peptostreptococcus faecalis]|uniref:hypothetical protein n=1 Tax=Peptostreptococcus faecalis TaxID=2045015 RepID=UPI000C7AB4A5|nr:hypothetical protein [Peptostreptococcus faecalis]